MSYCSICGSYHDDMTNACGGTPTFTEPVNLAERVAELERRIAELESIQRDARPFTIRLGYADGIYYDAFGNEIQGVFTYG